MDWFKYFFLSFFKDEYAEEAHKRSLLNSFLSLILAICIMCGLLFWGYTASIRNYYKQDEFYRNNVYDILARDDRKLSIKNNKFSLLDKTENPYIINERSDTMVIITDTRDIKNAFINFTINYKNTEGDSVSYENYLLLNESEKAKYAFSVQYSSELIDFNSSKIEEYESYLSSQSNDELKTQYSELQANKINMSDNEYSIKLYELFVRSYYPSEVMALDMYAFAPTLRTYYDDIISNTDAEFFVLYEDLLYTEFQHNDISYVITGNPENISNKSILSDNDIDALILQSFEQSKSYILIEYIFNFIRLLPILVIGGLILSFVPWLFFKVSKNNKMSDFLTSFKLINLYTLIAAIISGITGFALSWKINRGDSYRVSILCFFAIITVRLSIYLISRLIKSSKNE